MRANKNDKHHARAVTVFRILGASVQTLTRQKDGCPDLLIGYRGVDGLIEIKTGDRKPSDLQIEWHMAWRGRRVVIMHIANVCSDNELLNVCSKILERWI